MRTTEVPYPERNAGKIGENGVDCEDPMKQIPRELHAWI